MPNYESFLPVVRCVRRWAKARGLYSNKMGYLGGVNFNIMVAFACQVWAAVAAASRNDMYNDLCMYVCIALVAVPPRRQPFNRRF